MPRDGSARASARLTTSKPCPVVVRAGAQQARQESVAERLVMAVQLAVGRDHDQRRLVVGQASRDEPGLDPFRGECVGIGRGAWFERDRGRQAAVVQRDDDLEVAADLDPVGTSRLDVHVAGLPRREDRVMDPVLGEHPERGQVDRALRAARPRSPAGRSATRSHEDPRRSPSVDPRRTPAAGSCGGTAGRVRCVPGRRPRSRGRRPDRRAPASRRASGRGSTTSGRGFPTPRSGDSTRR